MSRLNLTSRWFLAWAVGLFAIGIGSVHGDETVYRHVVDLPPFIVEDQAVPLHWRYASSGQFEVLSLCSDRTTKEYMRQLASFQQQLDWILPAAFRYQTSQPITYILCDESMRKRLDQDIPVEMFLESGAQRKTPTDPGVPVPRFQSYPNLHLQDNDAYTIFALVNNSFLENTQLFYLPDAMEGLLRQRIPPLPPWFIRGFMYLYGRMSFTTMDQRAATMVGPVSEMMSFGGGLNFVRVSVPPFVWISDQESARVRRQSTAAVPLLPMEDLLVRPHPPSGPSEAIDLYDRRWTCQAALFVLCGLESAFRGPLDPNLRGPVNRNDHTWRESFWKFLARSSTEPVTEAMFRDCFGYSYDQMGVKLTQFRFQASIHPHNLGIAAPNPPPIVLRDATPSEVSVIKGDWERYEAAFVKRTYPGVSGTYLDQAHHTLWRAYDLGDRSPRLLAAMGLYECDAGDDAAALPLLTSAVQTPGTRPKAGFELARIRYAAELAKPAGVKGQLSAAQTASVFVPLAAAWKQTPLLLPACELLADVWLHSDTAPSRADLAELERETFFFPKSSHLILQIALLEAQAGFSTEANQLIDRALENSPDEAGKAPFLQLRALLTNQK